MNKRRQYNTNIYEYIGTKYQIKSYKWDYIFSVIYYFSEYKV